MLVVPGSSDRQTTHELAPRVGSSVSLCDPSDFAERTKDILAAGNTGAVVTFLQTESVAAALKSVTHVFADLDGTMLPSSTRRIPDTVVDAVIKLAEKGVSTTFVTGKPLSEIAELMAQLPSNFPGKFMFEKGAFFAERGAGDSIERKNLLTSPAVEQAIATIKNEWRTKWKPEIDQQYGVRLELAGDGTHASLFAVDVLKSDAPDDFADRRYGDRRAIKVPDQELLTQIFEDIKLRIEALGLPGLETLHARNLGQANFEYTGGTIEKDLAVKSMVNLAEARILTLGDSGNDAPMFALRDQDRTVLNALVYHAHTPDRLFSMVDFAVTGEARGDAMLALLLSHKA